MDTETGLIVDSFKSANFYVEAGSAGARACKTSQIYLGGKTLYRTVGLLSLTLKDGLAENFSIVFSEQCIKCLFLRQ